MEEIRILVVEDEPKVAEFIKDGLEEVGYIVSVAGDGLQGKNMVLSGGFDLVVLDLNLPHLNGFQLCRIIRENNHVIPILMLTALGGIEEKLKGFDSGADDYLIKPFEVRELVARIKVLIKRLPAGNAEAQFLKIADLEIDRERKTVKRAGKIINLSAKEYKLLEFLMLNKDKVMSRLDLTDQVWGINFDTGTNVVDVYVNFLRKKMDNEFEPKLVHTRIGLGYILSDKQE